MMSYKKYICMQGSCKVKYPCIIKVDETNDYSMCARIRDNECLLFKYDSAHWREVKKMKRKTVGKPTKEIIKKPTNRFADVEVVNDAELR